MSKPLFDKNSSKVKMVFMLKSGNNQLKYTNINGKLCNPVRYNYTNLNKYGKFKIAEKMLKSPTIKNSQEYKNANCILFYDTLTGSQFHKVNL